MSRVERTGETKNINQLTNSSGKVTDVNNDKPVVVEHSQHAPHSLDTEEDQVENKAINNIYRIGKTDTWGCNNCNLRDDKWFMQKHPCRGA